MQWISVNDRLPKEEKQYLICQKSILDKEKYWYNMAWFSNNLFKTDSFDFPKEEGYENKKGFYFIDSEYGYIEIESVLFWMDIEPPVDIQESQQDEIPSSTETTEFNGKKTFHLPRGEWQNKFCEFLENNNFDMYGYPQEDNYKDQIKDIGNFARFENDTFMLMPYYWGDDDVVMSLPNFIYRPENITISWYKYPLRGATSSEEITYDKFLEILKKCEESLK